MKDLYDGKKFPTEKEENKHHIVSDGTTFRHQ
jgi:hypothetical protein